MKGPILLLGTALFAVINCGAQSSLSNALDCSSLQWTTGGNNAEGWKFAAGSALSDNSFDAIDSAETGQTADEGESWLSTTVTGPGTISFWWNAYCEPGYEWSEGMFAGDWLFFLIDDVITDKVTGEGDSWPSGWRYCSYAIPQGTHTLTWKYVKDFGLTGGTEDAAWLDRVSYVSNQPSLAQALETCGVQWTSGGNTNQTVWFAQSAVTRDGVLAAQTGDIYHGQTNWIKASVVGATNVSFWWKVSSESSGDILEFFTNGVLAKSISGEVNWQSNYFRLPAGLTNTVTWSYRRNDFGTVGQNAGWLDQVAFSPKPASSAPYNVVGGQLLPDGKFRFQVQGGEDGCPCLVQFSPDLVHWNTLTNFTSSGSSALIVDPGASSAAARFYRARQQE